MPAQYTRRFRPQSRAYRGKRIASFAYALNPIPYILSPKRGLPFRSPEYNRRAKEGQILVLSIVILAVVSILVTSLYNRTINFTLFGYKRLLLDSALTLAEAGIDYSIFKLNTTGGYSGNPEINLGTGTFKADINPPGQSKGKTITSTGCIPNCTDPTATKRTITINVTGYETTISFPYALHGLQNSGTAVNLGSSSSITDGTVHSNSGVSCGTSTVSGIVEYASGPVPTCGTPQLSTIQSGPMTPQDIANWRTSAESGGTIDCATQPAECTITSTKTIGPRKYSGTFSIGDGANISVAGPIWITVDLNLTAISSFPQLQTTSLSSCGTVIVVDGKVNIPAGMKILASTTTPKGYLLIVTEDSSAGNAILLTGGSQAQYEGIFLAPNGKFATSLSGPNITSGAVIGSNIELSITNVTYGGTSNLAPAKFCGLVGNWQVIRGTYKIRQ